MTCLLLAEMPLGFNFIEILLHMANIAILLIVMRFLIYKPVKKFMAKRASEYATRDAETEKSKADAEALKEKYESLLNNAQSEALRISEDATLVANASAERIIQDAKKKATTIIEKTEEELRIKATEDKEAMAGAISELAVAMATKILDREFRQKDNDAVINLIVGEWKKN
ncbi:MAG: ATP synthase F0 subunit B [Christensenellaceae bacterium]|jgi:F-type H+-transporting ATPase subunit b|nr:ATP synthase F0 subunit B [Christensenellaceae bacterium]